MREPKTIRNAQTLETEELSRKAFVILNDASISDDEADAQIEAINARLSSLGIPRGGLTVKRSQYNR